MFGTAVLLAASVVVGQQVDATARGYFELYSPLVGTWDVTGEEEGETVFRFQFVFKPSTTKVCYRSESKTLNGEELGDGFHWYDPVKECWFDLYLGRPNDSYFFNSLESRADTGGGLVVGLKVKESGERVIEGKRSRTTSTRVYKEVGKDRIVFVSENRLTEQGEALPDMTVTMERK